MNLSGKIWPLRRLKNFVCANIVLFCILSCIFIRCNRINNPPSCIITHPANEAAFTRGELINITAEASDQDGSVSEMRFFINNKGIYSCREYPYSYKWNTAGKNTGVYKLRVVAIDEEGATDSAEVKVNLSAGGETGEVKDIEGNIYRTVKIGNQWWMAENLKAGHYADGSTIPFVKNKSGWDTLTYYAQFYCYYDFNVNNESDTFGALYTWTAATNAQVMIKDYIMTGPRGVCPKGWHLPTDAEWKQLEMNLGMDPDEVNGSGFRGSDEGAKLKTSTSQFWNCPNAVSTNESGFSALPGGRSWVLGGFDYLGTRAYFWTATGTNTSAWYRSVDCEIESVDRNKLRNKEAISVRCLKD